MAALQGITVATNEGTDLYNHDFARDCTALRNITDSITELGDDMNTTEVPAKVTERGYFLPNEDAWIKRLFLAYRNYRIAMYDIINRRRDYENRPPVDNAESFLVGFAASVLLYHWSQTFVHTFRDCRPVRKKLNEGDPTLGIEPDLFDEIYRSLTRIETQDRLATAADYYETWRTEFLRMFDDEDHLWLIHQIDELYDTMHRSQYKIWTRRLDRDLDITGRRAAKPLIEALYRMQSYVFDVFGNIWLDHIPSIPNEHIEGFLEIAQPGDVFIVRPERKSSTVFLPGWWTHGAVYFGGIEGLQKINATELPHVSGALDQLQVTSQSQTLNMIEALSPGIVLNPIQASMHVDHALLLRPRVTSKELLGCMDDLFSHLAKPYDFEFDFRRSDRLVCTELIYRGFHGKGNVTFNLTARFGHPTLSADDIITQVLMEDSSPTRAFDFVAISHKDMQTQVSAFETGDSGFDILRDTMRT